MEAENLHICRVGWQAGTPGLPAKTPIYYDINEVNSLKVAYWRNPSCLGETDLQLIEWQSSHTVEQSALFSARLPETFRTQW